MNKALLKMLADGRYHSGEDLGKCLGLTRSAVWKNIKQIKAAAIPVEAVHGRGYRVPGGIEFLQEDTIRAAITQEGLAHLSDLKLQEALPSTNTYLMDKARDGLGNGTVVSVEQQTAGRGRRGRVWQSPYARSISFSINWSFPQGPRTVEGLSIAVAVALSRALETYGIHGVEIKWPNDILINGKKLAGVLVEIFMDDVGTCHAVLGVGMNVELPKEQEIKQPWTDLVQIMQAPVERNRLLGLLLNEILLMLPQFESKGLAPFIEEWRHLDYLQKQLVCLETINGQILGEAQGIDNSGGLLVKTDTGTKAYHAGEVSVRKQA